MPDEWCIGVIVGRSGTGKTTIARHVFGDDYCRGFSYKAQSVIDDMLTGVSMDAVEKTLYSVGFSSVPSWLKPYAVLSEGEKMRCDLARALLEKDTVVFDEFTSVVDRTVAKNACIAINNALHQNSAKKFVAVTCHRDILDWLQPDWVFDTDAMQGFFGTGPAHRGAMPSGGVEGKSGAVLGVITI